VDSDRPSTRTRRYCFVAYYFPPWGGAAAQWSIKLVKYLARAGWTGSVVTVLESAPWLVDEAAARDLPSGIHVRRAANIDLPARLLKDRVRTAESLERHAGGRRSALRHSLVRFLRHLYDNYYILEGQLPWLLTATIAGWPAARRSDVILATIRPPSAALVGVLLKWLTRRPLVLDYRDFWTQTTTVRTGGLRRATEEWLERAALATADHVVAGSQGVADVLQQKFPHIAGKTSPLPLGFDPEDAATPGEGTPGSVSIVYAGSFFTSRNPDVFLRGLRVAIDREPALARTVRADFYGFFGGPGNNALIDELRLRDIVTVHGFVERRVALEAMRKADWLLLIIETLPSWNGIGYFTGAYTSKLFEYLAAGRPILALVPPSSAADVIRESRAGVVVANDDPEAVATVISAIAKGTYQGMSRDRDAAFIREFGMDRIAERLAGVFDTVARQRTSR
jgi:glycosyltransferase involved in cell wall biosynthesis